MTDMHTRPQVIESDNLSLAWGHIVRRIVGHGGHDIAPLVVSITGYAEDGTAAENPVIRETLDDLLKAEEVHDVENVAFTIFPQRYWRMAGHDRKQLYAMYGEAFDRIRDYNPRNNKAGSYFQRLTDFAGDGSGPNQLDWIIEEYLARPTARKSKWQATVFDPMRDITTSAQKEFPCMQQISFTFDGNRGLILNAFYATQQMIRKGYGNYLGLSRLGAFMAHEMGLRFVGLNVFVGIAKSDSGKSSPSVKKLLAAIESQLPAQGGAGRAA